MLIPSIQVNSFDISSVLHHQYHNITRHFSINYILLYSPINYNIFISPTITCLRWLINKDNLSSRYMLITLKKWIKLQLLLPLAVSHPHTHRVELLAAHRSFSHIRISSRISTDTNPSFTGQSFKKSD